MKKALFIGIFLVSLILRFYKLGEIPPSLTWDEAAWGYNAYSLGVDGRDEFGRLLPVDYIESFGDFKPPAYAYLTILPVKFFGLSEFAVRFASAFFGVLTVGATFFLTRELVGRKDSPAFFAMAILAVSPWHINLSRAAFEANVATFFLTGGVLLFLMWANGVKKLFILLCSGILFVLALYSFNTARIVGPLLVALLAAGFWRDLWKYKFQAVVVGIVCTVLSIPFLQFALTPQAQLRYREVNIFSDSTLVEQSNAAMEQSQRAWCGEITPSSDCRIPIYARLLHNRRVYFTRAYLKHYFDHFNPSFLFIKGDGNPKFSTQDVGQMYLAVAPFLFAGMVVLIRRKKGHWWIVPLWLAAGIVPAATARETPHALRIASTLPTWQIASGIGMWWAYSRLQKVRKKRRYRWLSSGIVVCTLLLMVANITYYLHGYYVHYAREYSGEWQYGYREAISFIKNHPEYERVSMTNKLGRPYVYALFYEQYDPARFREESDVSRETYGFVHVHSFGRYIFSESPGSIPEKGRTLVVDVPEHIPDGVQVVAEFYLLNGERSLVAYEI